MKFTCEKYLLQEAVATASRAASSKSPIPALEGLLLEAGTEVRITGYDLKKGIYTSFAADVADPGAVVLGARIFGDIVRSLPDGIVSVTTDGLMTRITCGAADFSIMGTDASEYPELPEVDRQNAVSLPQMMLSQMIRQTIFAVSDNESRPIYTGSLLCIEGDTLTIVSVDGFRLALRKEKLENEQTENCSFVVPGAALSDLEKLCTEENETVQITVGARHISFVVGKTVLISRRLEGEFFDYKKSVPTAFNIKAGIARDELLRVVSRVSLIINEKNKSPLRLTFNDDQIRLNCVTAVGKADDVCSMKGQGNGLEIGFNNRYLLDALRAAPADELLMGLNTSVSPCVLLPADESDSFAYMILPVRLKPGT